MKIKEFLLNKTNKHIILNILLLGLIGLFFLYDVTSGYTYNTQTDKFFFLKRQTAWLTIGFFSIFLIYKIPKNLLEILFKIITIFTIICLIGLLLSKFITPLNIIFESRLGANRWVNLNPEGLLPAIPFLGRLSFQPAEITKLILAYYLPYKLIELDKDEKLTIREKLLVYFLITAFFSFLILLQPDLKSVLIIFSISISIIIGQGINITKIVPFAIVGLIIIALSIILTGYRSDRLDVYLGKEVITENGTNLADQIKYIESALVNGGLIGEGIGLSKFKHEYIPEISSDSIFAIIGEEIGFLGVLILLIIYFKLFLSLYIKQKEESNRIKKLYLNAINTWFLMQIFLNIGSVVGLIPFTGVPLPLISYGGSSLIFFLAGIGLTLREDF